ncbi:hypothetical protein ABZ942_13365 [Nocardia sp. NPDC046473]|uniref:hypothetical protein n=1 Tax=Nocardia sp. NPDC046473 TaxID=3155733 RepID=UPI0033BFE93D
MSANNTPQRSNADESFRTAADLIADRVLNADKLPDQCARDRFVQRAPQALRIAAYATEVLGLCSRAIDEAIATGRLKASEVEQIPRAERESLLADWALVHARAYEGDGLVEDFDIVLSSRLGLLQLGFDPAALLPPE